jgi:hypothetical protein
MKTIEELQVYGLKALATVLDWATSPQFYAQVGAIILAVAAAQIVAKQIRTRVPFFKKNPARVDS